MRKYKNSSVFSVLASLIAPVLFGFGSIFLAIFLPRNLFNYISVSIVYAAFAITGIIFGIVSLFQIRKTHERGIGHSLVGIIAGILLLLGVVILVFGIYN